MRRVTQTPFIAGPLAFMQRPFWETINLELDKYIMIEISTNANYIECPFQKTKIHKNLKYTT